MRLSFWIWLGRPREEEGWNTRNDCSQYTKKKWRLKSSTRRMIAHMWNNIQFISKLIHLLKIAFFGKKKTIQFNETNNSLLQLFDNSSTNDHFSRFSFNTYYLLLFHKRDIYLLIEKKADFEQKKKKTKQFKREEK